ncbi:MAG: glycosyl hydrolase [Polyangiales bacterium]
MGIRLTCRPTRSALVALLLALPGATACSTSDAPDPAPTDDGAVDATTDVSPDVSPDSPDVRGLDGARPDSGAEVGNADPIGVTAIRAEDFLRSLGVCTHVGQGIDAPTESAAALSYAGMRNIRDDGRPSAVKNWIAMHAVAGVRLSLLTNHDVASTIAMAKELNAASALLAVEGPNEPNNFAVTYGGATSGFDTTFVPVAKLQRDLYAAVKGEPALASIPVFHASEAGGSEPDDVGLQFLTIPAGATTAMPAGTKYADYANVHNYVTGHSAKLVDDVAWKASDPTLNGDWDGMYVEYGRTWHKAFAGYSRADLITLPKVTTETGWQTSGAGSINEEQQARLFLDLYLSAFARGFTYTFIYMLRDDPTQGSWGLFDTGYKPKKSATYLHNLTTILADAGGRTPEKLDYAITGAPATVHQLLLQKSSGSFALVVWNDRPLGGSDVIAIDLKRSRSMVTVYDPTTGVTPTETLRAVTSVALTLTDHPVVVEL